MACAKFFYTKAFCQGQGVADVGETSGHSYPEPQGHGQDLSFYGGPHTTFRIISCITVMTIKI